MSKRGRRRSKKYKKYFAGRSKNTWGLKTALTRIEYKCQLASRDGERCNKCKQYFDIQTLTTDHIIPISSGGPVDELANMQLLCIDCHMRKTKRERK
jgi:5-methylcytosine-specific restriction endonuclease McrA